ncbi:hypothetical protein TX23_13520 [Pseudomonas paralactis]|uniref:Uncharacterized protein n=1 Tax=Pseudomonas paralactis TaxID=1615673 RepID=A0A0R3AP11_9PSED|nr:hypothetical protein TX23_13520 [Pseudomonas paralactis]
MKPASPETKAFCRSELAREKLTDAAFIQKARVIVDAFRKQARSYRTAQQKGPLIQRAFCLCAIQIRT